MEWGKRTPKSTVSLISPATDWDLWALCRCGRQPRKSRLNRLSVFPAKTSDRKRSTTKTSLLTGQQRLIVNRTWHKLSVDISTLGIGTMTRLLYSNPPLARLFSFLAPHGPELQFDPRFRQHAFWLIQAVSATVENLDDLDLMVSDMFMEIGAKHTAIPKFSSDMFKILPAAWAFVWEEHLRERFTTQTDKSWAKIFNYIVDRLMDGCSNCVVLEEIVTYPPTTAASATDIAITDSTISVMPDSTSSFIITEEDDSDSDSDDSTMQASRFDGTTCQLLGDPSTMLVIPGTEESTVIRKSSEGKSRKERRKSSNKHSSASRDQDSRKSSLRKTSEPTSQQNTNTSCWVRPSSLSVMSSLSTLSGPPPSKSLPPLEEPSLPGHPKADPPPRAPPPVANVPPESAAAGVSPEVSAGTTKGGNSATPPALAEEL